MNINPIIEKILSNRGIEGEELQEFLSLRPQKMYDPFLLPSMEEGVDLILSAIENDEKICIYGDYDADGVTSVSIMMDVLSNLTDNLCWHIPSRFNEGYGLNCEALKEIREDGCDLVVTVDCGSVSKEEVEYGESIGLTMLVTDHHTVTDKRAGCPIINPVLPESTYPFKYLAGAGVAFKLAQAIVQVTGLPKQVLTRVMDLAALGTIGDIVPLVDENRTIAKYGLRLINVTERKGLIELISRTGLQVGNVKSENISFIIVPHINASGRMGSADHAARLMQTKDQQTAEEESGFLIEYNKERKSKQNTLYKACVDAVEEKYIHDHMVLLQLTGAHQGITGIVAGKLKERYERPCLIASQVEDGLYKGTGRSVAGINLYDLLKKAEPVFEGFGGHSAACGFTIKKENIPQLRKILKDETDRLAQEDISLFKEPVVPDISLTPDQLDMDFIKGQELMEPFGRDNDKPKIAIRVNADNLKRMGNQGQYLSFYGRSASGNGGISCVVFKNADSVQQVLMAPGVTEIVGTVSNNSFRGKDRLQMMVLKAEKI